MNRDEIERKLQEYMEEKKVSRKKILFKTIVKIKEVDVEFSVSTSSELATIPESSNPFALKIVAFIESFRFDHYLCVLIIIFVNCFVVSEIALTVLAGMLYFFCLQY